MAVGGEGPNYARYVRSLPGGLGAYPAAQAKGALVRSVLSDQPAALRADLPEPLRPWSSDLPLDNGWVSEALFGALIHAVGERRGWGADALVDWTRRRNLELLSGPLYRILMRVATPAALLRHAGLRWANFHRGSTLTFSGFSDDGVRFSLAYPKGLYDELLLRSLGAAFAAALELSSAADPVVEIERSGEGVAWYRARW